MLAKLIFKYSTMNSGKTMDLIRTIYNYEENGYKIILLKPFVDSKSGDYIETRAGLKRKVDYLIKDNESIIDILRGNLKGIKCIFIDEAQFLDEKQIDELFLITKALNIPVICYGLRNNFKMDFFSGSKRLFEIADTLEEFKTLCHCGKIARYVGRKVNDKYTLEGDTIVIDGEKDVEYKPLCGYHYLKEVKNIDFDKIREELK